MMNEKITCQIEKIDYNELLCFMRQQAEDAFPFLKDEERLLAFSKKLHTHAEFCVCRDNGKLVGMIAFYANGEGADFAYIPHVYVSPQCRQQGLFTRMLNIVTNYMKGKGFGEVRLEVDMKNDRAEISYLRNGFRKSEEATPFSIYMSKTL